MRSKKKNDSPELENEDLGFINMADVVKGAASYVTGRKVLETIDKVKSKSPQKGIINSNQLREMEFQLLPFFTASAIRSDSLDINFVNS